MRRESGGGGCKRGGSITHSSNRRDITRADRWAPLSARRRNNTSSLCSRRLLPRTPSYTQSYRRGALLTEIGRWERFFRFIIYSPYPPPLDHGNMEFEEDEMNEKKFWKKRVLSLCDFDNGTNSFVSPRRVNNNEFMLQINMLNKQNAQIVG